MIPRMPLAIMSICLWANSPPVLYADAFDDYIPAAAFSLPAGTDTFDVLPDGRLIALVGDAVHVETALRARSFTLHGVLPRADIASFGAAFLRVSPNGTRLAVGNNGGASFADYQVGVFAFPVLAGDWVVVNHFDAEWYDDTHLAITAGAFGVPSYVTLLDTTSTDPLNPINPVVVGDIGGAPAGIGFDAVGNLYTGNGFQTAGPSGTGVVKVFASAEWTAAAGGSPLNFETMGVVVVDVLSASSLGFDDKGNLYVGGGDLLGLDSDFAALVRAAAVQDAMMGLGPADAGDPADVRRFDPDSKGAMNFYAVSFNPVTRELYFADAADDVVHVYVPNPSQPADPWADEVTGASPALDGSGIYNDPESLTGAPAAIFYDPFLQQQRIVSLVSPALNLDAPGGNRLITTINPGQFTKVRFDEPVEDHPRNPYGIDLIVFGNSFFIGDGFFDPDKNLEAYILSGAIFAEPILVAVSPTGLGDPQTHPDQWYTYQNGPFGDSLFPTNAYGWDRQANDWGDALDFTLPVDPSLQLSAFAGASAADGIDRYACSGGGTGFDLAESGFSYIHYVYLTGSGGEVDALADVFPSLGDFDRDGDVDLLDFSRFQNCFGIDLVEEGRCDCRSADFDGALRPDLIDHGSLISYFSGPR